jgi:penicillin amidase
MLALFPARPASHVRGVRRAILVLLAVLVVVPLLLVAGAAGLLWGTLPPSHDLRAVPGLAAPVSIAFEEDGVPRIRAGSEADAATALGYVHARDRLFQMELTRRAASGRLSELAGPATLPLDRMARVMGLQRRAEAELALLDADARGQLDAYARGVNALVAERGRLSAPEFLVLGQPEPWTPVDSLLWGEVMGTWLSGNWRDELTRAALDDKLPPAKVDQLWPAESATTAPWATLVPAATARRLLAALPLFPGPFTEPATASDAWAVDGPHSATGAPILAGDPHLAFGMPGLWYLARIELPGRALAGATAPGVPFLVLGQNGHVAWSFTTTGADTQDLFVETVLPNGRYETPDGPQPFIAHEEHIAVRGRPDEVLTVRETRHGPVVSDVVDPRGPVLALAASNLMPGAGAAAGLLALNRAQSVDEAGQAAPRIASPVQNLLVADRSRIALFTTGRVPVRKTGDGSRPVPGASGAYDWTGFASGDALPHAVAPATGRLLNGNERTAPPDFPVFLGRDWFGDWRARRIRALLDANRMPGVAEFAQMQVDSQSAYAVQVLPRLLAAEAPPGLPAAAQALLRGWDGMAAVDRPQALIFNAWMRRFLADVLARNNVPEGTAFPRDEFAAWVLTPPGAAWCGGECGPLLAASLGEASNDLAARYGGDPARWHWGDAHQAVFAHPILGRLPVIGPLLTVRVEQPGDNETLFRGGMARDGFASVHGAGYRGVYDLADPDRSRFIAVPGQSGNLLSAHAQDMIGRWLRGEGLELGPDGTEDDAAETVDLVP